MAVCYLHTIVCYLHTVVKNQSQKRVKLQNKAQPQNKAKLLYLNFTKDARHAQVYSSMRTIPPSQHQCHEVSPLSLLQGLDTAYIIRESQENPLFDATHPE